MKLPIRSLALSVFGALAALSVGCAHAPAVDNPKETRKALPQQVLVTGSHIPTRVDPSTGLATTSSGVRTYDRGEINSTGRQTDIGAALRALDPSISR